MGKIFALVLASLVTLSAQERKPKPAFAGQTEAPRPAKASTALNIQTIATGLVGAWAMAFLPDNAISLIADDEVEKYQVVRIADEIIVDLLKTACGVDYARAADGRDGIHWT